MYAVSLRAQIKDGRIDELKEFIKNSALPTLEVPGMISIGFLIQMQTQTWGWLF